MLHIKLQASDPRDIEEEDFLTILYVFLWFKPRIL